MTAATAKAPSAELQAIRERVERGIEWLTSHDPSGAFHLWFESKIQPFHPMPGQTEQRRDEYRAYFKNRTVFEKLWVEMTNRERAEGIE